MADGSPPSPADVRDMSLRLQKRLELGARTMRVLMEQINRAEELSASLAAERAGIEVARSYVVGPPAAPAAAPAEAAEEVKGLHALIDELIARCASLERERAGAATAERALLAALHEELRSGLDELGSTLDALRAERLDKSARSLVEPARLSVGALADLVGGLRDVGPGSVGGGAAAGGHATFDLREALGEVNEFLARRAAGRSVAFSCAVDDALPPLVHGDRARLRQLVLHVGHAAIRFAGEGVVELSATCDGRADREAVLRVAARHEGRGLPRELLAALDGAEAVVEGADTVAAGLRAARGLAERLGGRLGIESEEGERFLLWFSAPLALPNKASGERRRENRLRVTSVESNLGPVVNLSLGGAEIRSRKRLAGQLTLEIRAGDAQVSLEAEVVRTKRLGLRSFECGLRFLDVSAESARRLTRISMEHRVRALMGGEV